GVEVPTAEDKPLYRMALSGEGKFPQSRQHQALGDIFDALGAFGAKVVPVDNGDVVCSTGADSPAISNRAVNDLAERIGRKQRKALGEAFFDLKRESVINAIAQGRPTAEDAVVLRIGAQQLLARHRGSAQWTRRNDAEKGIGNGLQKGVAQNQIGRL